MIGLHAAYKDRRVRIRMSTPSEFIERSRWHDRGSSEVCIEAGGWSSAEWSQLLSQSRWERHATPLDTIDWSELLE